jgi:hypothetical protein
MALDDNYLRILKKWSLKNKGQPIIADDDIRCDDIADLVDEIDRLKALVVSENQRFSDECDRIVCDWHDKVEEIKKNSHRSPGNCTGCGAALVPQWVCDGFTEPGCPGHDGDGDV